MLRVTAIRIVFNGNTKAISVFYLFAIRRLIVCQIYRNCWKSSVDFSRHSSNSDAKGGNRFSAGGVKINQKISEKTYYQALFGNHFQNFCEFIRLDTMSEKKGHSRAYLAFSDSCFLCGSFNMNLFMNCKKVDTMGTPSHHAHSEIVFTKSESKLFG